MVERKPQPKVTLWHALCAGLVLVALPVFGAPLLQTMGADTLRHGTECACVDGTLLQQAVTQHG